MRKISAILSVYNEESLLGLCLKQIEPYVDEIVIVDGGPLGPSDDKTPDIVKDFTKAKYLSGTYKTRTGAWDLTSQRNHGISEASGDVYLFLSADMLFYNFEYLCEVIRKEEDVKVFFCNTVEFWLDTNHIRLYAQLANLSIPGGVSEAVAIARESQPIAGEHGSLEIVTPKPREQMMVGNTTKYHLGWIRPFKSQVEKHIRHIEQGRWGDAGKKLMEGTQQKLEQWAILHVLSYKQIPSVDFRFQFPDEWQGIKDMNYLNGQSDFVKYYEERYGTSFLRGIKS